MKTRTILLVTVLSLAVGAEAQRPTDDLDRGLVAVPTGATGGSTTNFVSWRRLAEEYYGVTYNLYRNGSRVASNLTRTSYDDSGTSASSTYQVAAVVNGVEQTRCAAVRPWQQYVYRLGSTRTCTGFLDIALAPVFDRTGADVTGHYEPNDAEMADLDGDGQLEIIIKRLNTVDAADVYPQSNTTEFVVIDAYDVNWQTGGATLLWRIDCGPNMVSLNSTEINIIAFDWDEDGRAEVILRGADNMIVYGPDGRTQLYTIGSMSTNTRNTFSPGNGPQYAWTHTGAEYLIYMNGQTGARYQIADYPLPRQESGESSLKSVWGDDYGHRSTKHLFGAPFLDGRRASLFIGRGIYTRHKFIAMDLDRGSHQWRERWRWNCTSSGSAWYGNGYHNFIIADVDEDGRDEIVYGSMVIDDNGRGLSTTGYGHGDAQNVGDLDPYRKGLEFFGCLEESRGGYGFNYRNATTSEIYYKHNAGGDDGRSLAANFSNSYPGSMGRSSSSGIISCTSDQLIGELGGDGFIAWGDLNFRIYWDGDLCSEILNSPGTAREAKVEKPGTGRIFTSSGCNMNNDSKNNPCFQGDIIGDWREEIVVRCGGNLRVYTTGISTQHDIYNLWHDHQYRQAMVWQMMAYNQAPYTSFFLGEMEGITVAPPPLTRKGRTEVTGGGAIGTSYNGQHVMIDEQGDASFSVAAGAAPAVLTVNTPTWVQGSDNNSGIRTTVYRHALTGGAFGGAMRLTKQGDGTLVMPAAAHTYTGRTDVWGGTLVCDGSLASPVWLNRFTALSSDGGSFGGGITAEYAARLLPGGEGQRGSLTTTTLTLGFGARLVLDVYSDMSADQVNADRLVLNTVSWNHGPKYKAPVIEFAPHPGRLPNGTYQLGRIGTVEGDLASVVVEGLGGTDYELKVASGQLTLKIGDGVAAQCPEATITETSLAETPAGILLPIVDVAAQPFALPSGATAAPVLSATFVALDGSESSVSLGEEFYAEDYEQSDAVSGWTSPGAAISLGTGDDGHGKFFNITTGTTNTRYAYTRPEGLDVGRVGSISWSSTSPSRRATPTASSSA